MKKKIKRGGGVYHIIEQGADQVTNE